MLPYECELKQEIEMSINQFDKPTLRKLSGEIQTAIDAVAKKNGIKIVMGNARLDYPTVMFKLNCTTIASDGTVQTKESKDLARLYPQYVDKAVTLRGKKGLIHGTVVGFKTRGRNYPFLVKTVDGKTYKVGESTIR